MVSESELIGRLQEFLRNSDLNTTTTAIVRRKLEEDFGIDLSEKKAFIREQVDLFLQSQLENDVDDGDIEGDDEEEEEEDQAVNVKSEGSDSKDNGDDEEEEVEEASNRKGTKKRGSNKLDNEVKKRGGGFTKLCSLSPQLQEFVGVSELARTEVVKKLWIYIREKNLQDPSNRREIICDESLRALFGVNSINMFQMNKALSKHIWPLDSNDVIPVKSVEKEKSGEKEKKRKQKKEEETDKPEGKDKRQKGRTSGFLAPLPISDALIKFFGSGEKALSRADVVKKMWDYIKQNDLQDPSDKRRVICDEKLKELFDVDSFHGFTCSKLLSAHFIKSEQ